MYGREPTQDKILSEVSEFDIFNYYITEFEDVGIPFCSELREDNNPSCCIQEYRGRLLYKDFGNGEAHNVFSYIKSKFSVSFIDALCIISNDFGLSYHSVDRSPSMGEIGRITQAERTQSKELQFSLSTRKFNDHVDKKFWFDRYNIDKPDLQIYNIKPLKWFRINGFRINESYRQPIYAFKLDRNIFKIYRPFSEKKWFSNVSKHHYQGYDQLPTHGNTLIITSSMKDVIVLAKIGIPAIAPQSESQKIPKSFMEELKKRFINVVVLYDHDEAGIQAANKLSEEHSIPILFTQYKDPSDSVMSKGFENTKQEIWENLEKILK